LIQYSPESSFPHVKGDVVISGMTIGCIGAIGAGYQAAAWFSRASIRRREARALRAILLSDIHHGRRSFSDPAVHDLLVWADTVVASGRDVPLLLR
jgi:hypothetical protein